MIHVTMDLPTDAPSCEKFCFPFNVPGHYSIYHYSKSVSNLVFTNFNGDTLRYTRNDTSFFLFDSAQKVHRVSYDLSHTYCSGSDTLPLFAGTFFTSSVWLINGYAAFGYFPELLDKPVRLHVKYPGNWVNGTSLQMDSSGFMYAENYRELQDGPVLAGDHLSQSAFSIGNRKYFIYTHSDWQGIRAGYLRRTFKSAAFDAEIFLGGIPADVYTFLILLKNGLSPGQGAHEHLRSSVYSLSSGSLSEVRNSLEWIARHEIFHTLTPLSLQSDEIFSLDFTNPEDISHLWFYEGLAQWAAFKMRLTNHTYTEQEYLNVLSSMLYAGDTYEDTLSLIEISRKVLVNHDFLSDIYRRGFVLGAALDMYIVSATKGRTTLREVLLEMRDKYPRGKYFQSDSVFDIIASLSHPYVREFCEKHIAGNQPIPFQNLLSRFGITYEARISHPLVSSELGITLNSAKLTFPVRIGGVLNECRASGYQKGDTLISINGTGVNQYTFPSIMRTLMTGSPGTAYTAEVKRNGETLSLQARTIAFYKRHVIVADETEDEEKEHLREVWKDR